MAYIESNVRRSASTFLSIRSVGGVGCTNDVYVRDPDTKTDKGGDQGQVPMSSQFFYVGKIARCDGTVPTPTMAVARAWNLIEEHACRLRPVELGRGFGRLEVWVSKGRGDKELEMSLAGTGDGDEEMALAKMERFVEGSEGVGVSEVGFMAEVVTNRGQGLYIIRDGEGRVMQ